MTNIEKSNSFDHIIVHLDTFSRFNRFIKLLIENNLEQGKNVVIMTGIYIVHSPPPSPTLYIFKKEFLSQKMQF